MTQGVRRSLTLFGYILREIVITTKKKPSRTSNKTSRKVCAKGRDDKPAKQVEFPIVGIGASAGGLETFSALFKNLPSDLGMAKS